MPPSLITVAATEAMHSLNVTDTANVQQVLVEYSAMVRARDANQADKAFPGKPSLDLQRYGI